MSFCSNCGKIRKDRTLSTIKTKLESGLSQGKSMFRVANNQREPSNRVAKLQETFFIMEKAINEALKRL